jgi:glycosyltransferase involved in cell wall biosynthesis
MKVFGIVINQGYPSSVLAAEIRVFAQLLANRADRYDALVCVQDWPENRTSADRFSSLSNARVTKIDMGWRPNPFGRRSAFSKAGSFLRFRAMLPEMLRIARTYEPDVIISSQQRWDCFAASYIAKRLNRAQIIQLYYPIGPSLGRHVVSRLLECDHVIAVDEYARADAMRHGVRPDAITKVLPPMTPLPAAPEGARREVRAELGIPDGAPLIGIVARIDPQKRQTDVIAAFGKIAARHPDARLLIVGTPIEGGTPMSVLHQLAADTGFRDRIIFEGYRPDFARILAAMDIFIHPSIGDTISLAPMEASAAGLPVVAYAESGALETVVHERTGLLAPPCDVDSLADCLDRLLADPETAKRMGNHGREYVRDAFSPERWGRVFADAIRRAVDSKVVPYVPVRIPSRVRQNVVRALAYFALVGGVWGVLA